MDRVVSPSNRAIAPGVTDWWMDVRWFTTGGHRSGLAGVRSCPGGLQNGIGNVKSANEQLDFYARPVN